MSKPDAPAPPNLVGAAQQTGQSNIQSAIANALLGHINQNTPWGSQTWSNTGGGSGPAPSPGASPTGPPPPGGGGFNFGIPLAGAAAQTPGPSPNPSSLPQFTETTTLSPEQQAIFNQQQQTQGRVAGAAGQIAGNINTSPLDFSGAPPMPSGADQASQLQNVQNALYARQSQYLDPQFAKGQDQLNTQLANQGFQAGDAGVSNASGTGAQDAFNMAKQKAYADARDAAIAGSSSQLAQNTQTALAGRQQAISEALAQRNQPINELAALGGGGSIGMPQFPGTGGTQGIPGADFLGAATGQNAANLQNYGIQAGQYNSQMGGLMGLGSSALLYSLLA